MKRRWVKTSASKAAEGGEDGSRVVQESKGRSPFSRRPEVSFFIYSSFFFGVFLCELFCLFVIYRDNFRPKIDVPQSPAEQLFRLEIFLAVDFRKPGNVKALSKEPWQGRSRAAGLRPF